MNDGNEKGNLKNFQNLLPDKSDRKFTKENYKTKTKQERLGYAQKIKIYS